MGNKYTITGVLNGFCLCPHSKRTNNIFIAIWYLIILNIKYPIVDFQIRRGYIPCEKCGVDYCEYHGRETEYEYETNCEYCTIDSGTRKVLGYDGSNDGIGITYGDGVVAINSDSWEFEINYCPICGRRLI